MSQESKPFMVKTHDIHMDSEFTQWICDLKSRYHRTQIKAAIKVNSEQLLFNWQLGRDLVERKAEEKWGKGIVEQVSLELQAEFPDVKGFSVRNLWNMKKWYSFYSSHAEQVLSIAEQMLITVSSEKLHQLGAEIREDTKLQQAGAEMEFPMFFGYVPWRHHVEIITKCKSVEEALFYVRKTVEEGYSRSALINLIEADLYHKEGSALTNFGEQLQFPQKQLHGTAWQSLGTHPFLLVWRRTDTSCSLCSLQKRQHPSFPRWLNSFFLSVSAQSLLKALSTKKHTHTKKETTYVQP